jgi:hypothetical protein
VKQPLITVTVAHHRDAIEPLRVFRNSCGRARAEMANTKKIRNLSLAHRWAMTAYSALLKSGDYLAKAGLEIPNAPKDPRPERYDNVYGRLREETMFRCTLCSALCWREKREDHLYHVHDISTRNNAEVVDQSFIALAPETNRDEYFFDDEDSEDGGEEE